MINEYGATGGIRIAWGNMYSNIDMMNQLVLYFDTSEI
jgi:hypothetical protein